VRKSCWRGGGPWLLAWAAVGATLLSGTAAAQPVVFEGSTFVNQGLVGVARVPSDAREQFGDTLGGFGSAIAVDLNSWKKNRDGSYTGSLFMVPDRGWNTQGTVDYRGRVHSFDVTLQPFTGASTTQQDQLSMTYLKSIPLHEAGNPPGLGRGPTNKDGTPTTGIDPLEVRPGSFGLPDLPASDKNRIAVDNEGIVLVGDQTMWISDEYGPYVYHYDISGRLLGAISPPEAFIPKRLDANNQPVENFSANSPPIGQSYNLGNPVSGRQNNQGFEGLAMSPDRKTLFILLQSALIQDLDATSSATIRHTRKNTRLLAYDVRGKEPTLTGEYVVQLPQFPDPASTTGQTLTAAQSELHALNDTQFLVLARDSGNGFSGSGSTSKYRSVDLIDISHATNLAGSKFDSPANPIAPGGALDPTITPALYQKFLDINDNTQLNRFGLRNGDPNDTNNLYEKWEGLAVVPVFDPAAPNDYFLFVASDNDFIAQNGFMVGQPYSDKANVDSLVLIYRMTLPTYVPPHGSGRNN
jgi:hypothetical protein